MEKSFHRHEGFDFHETFSLVVKHRTIRVILMLALTHMWNIQQIDINNAFLNGGLQEEVYMQQPTGFVDNDPYLVCKLKKAIYGFKQAPRAWYEKLHHALMHFGFLSNRYDHSLFTYQHKGITLYTLVYVDDMLITGTSSKLVHDLISILHQQFSLKKLGKPKHFLDLEVHKQKNVLLF